MSHTTKLIFGIFIASTSAQATQVQLQGDSATYNTQSNTVILNKNATAQNSQGILQSHNIIYNQATKIITATGNARFTISNINRPIVLQADKMTYNQKDSFLLLNTNAKAENNQAVLQSQRLQYNQLNDIITAIGDTVFISKINPIVLQGENAVYDGTQQTLVLDNNAKAENTQAMVQSQRLQYNQLNNIITATGDTVFTSKTNPIVLQGENAVYDGTRQTLVLDTNAKVENDRAILQSQNITYDQKADIIRSTQDTIFTAKTDNIILSGHQALYDRKTQMVIISKGASAESTNGILHSDKIVYRQATNTINATGGVQYNSTNINIENRLILTGEIAQYDGNVRQLIVRNNTTATGVQGKLKANTIIYNESLDLVRADGNVSYTNNQGDFSTMDTLRSNLAFDTISGTNINRLLQNNVRVSAQTFQTYPNGDMQTEKSTYTSCVVPEGENAPTWLMRADKVTLDAKQQNIAFTNSRMELAGIPIYYWPYLEQPTPDVVKKDGWLMPDSGTSNVLGIFIQGHYYKSLSDTSDSLISPIYTARKGQGVEVTYRKNNLKNTIIRHNLSAMQSTEGDDIQGHWFASYTKNTNRGWQYKLNHENVTDKNYLKTYTLLNKATKDSLRTGVSATKINQNSILEIDSASYRDIRKNGQPVTTLFPSLRYEKTFHSASGNSNLNIRSMVRSVQKRGQLKSHTMSTTATYSRPFITQQGMLIKTDLIGRADAYKYRYYDTFTVNGEDRTQGSLIRFTPMASVVASYPLSILAKNLNPTVNRQVILEPVVGAFISRPNKNPDWFPNNDSVDFELDESTLFANNRYAGVDKIDAVHRISYGSRLKIWQDDTYIQAFLGQNISQSNNNTASDFIGSLYAKWQHIDMYAHFELDSHSFNARKLESNVVYVREKYALDIGYTKINPRVNSQLDPLAQTKLGVAYQINKKWRLKTEHSYEFEQSKKGLIRQSLGFEYNTDCGCFGANISYQQDFSKSESDPDKSLFVQFKFREVGNIQERF